MATSIEKILRGAAYSVTLKCRMEFDDAYQELAIAELSARRRYRFDYETKSGKSATYETYLRRVLEGFSMKLVARNLRGLSYSLDEMLDRSPDGEQSGGAQVHIAYDEHRYKGVNWKVFIEQVAVDEIDVFIMGMLLDGWNQSEIANLLDYTQSAVRQRLNRYKDEFSTLMTA